MTKAGLPGPIRNMSSDEVRARAEKARRAADQWRRYSLTERVELVRALWAEILARRDELVRVIHEETGKPFAEIEAMELGTVDLIQKYFTANAHRVLQDQAVWKPWIFFNKRAFVRQVPRGLIGLITPWNLPFLIPFGDAIPALLAGNAVLIKPSEWTSRTMLWIENAVKVSALLPEGLFCVVTGDSVVGKQVVAEAEMILFTGSTRSGKLVAQAAAADLKPAVLELGGKHPMIVFKDASIARAAQAAVWGAFANCGQLCVGVERVYVETEVHDAFVEAVRGEMAGLRQGLGGRDVDIGRFIFPPQLERAQEHLEDARSKGARVFGGEVVDAEKLMMRPALVLGATHDMKVMTEETFGPVMPVMRVERAEEAIRLSNQGDSGLAASLWTQDLAMAERLGASVEAGLLGINDLLSHYAIAAMPFGGVKSSGMGRRHSDEGLRMFCYPQSVLVHEWPAALPELWWFPYKSFKSRLISLISRVT